MSTSKDIVVQDACVIFDLIDLGLIHRLFQLHLDVYTTPQVIDEIEDPEQLGVVNGLISTKKLRIMSDGDLDAILRIITENRGLSYADGSVLEFAIRVNGAVLSSDMKLRNATVRNNLTVRGVLWVIGELHQSALLSTLDAVEALQTYERINVRAPRMEIRSMIERLLSSKA